jgi:hypothetical protein
MTKCHISLIFGGSRPDGNDVAVVDWLILTGTQTAQGHGRSLQDFADCACLYSFKLLAFFGTVSLPQTRETVYVFRCTHAER